MTKKLSRRSIITSLLAFAATPLAAQENTPVSPEELKNLLKQKIYFETTFTVSVNDGGTVGFREQFSYGCNKIAEATEKLTDSSNTVRDTMETSSNFLVETVPRFTDNRLNMLMRSDEFLKKFTSSSESDTIQEFQKLYDRLETTTDTILDNMVEKFFDRFNNRPDLLSVLKTTANQTASCPQLS